MKKKIFSKRLLINSFFVFIILLIPITDFFSDRQLGKILAANQWVEHTHKVIESVQNVFSGILEIESAARSFVVTKDNSFVLDFDESVKKVYDNLNFSKNLTKDNLGQQNLLQELESLLNDRMKVIKEAMSFLLKNNGLINNEVMVSSVQKSHHITERIKDIAKEIIDNENTLLQQRKAALVLNSENTYAIFNAIDIASVIFLLLVIFILNKMLSNMLAAQFLAKKTGSLLKNIIGNSKEYIVAFDLDCNFLEFNEAFEKEFYTVFGKHIKIGMNIKEALKDLPDERNKILSLWQRALKGEEFTIISNFGLSEKTQAPYEISYSSMYDDNNQLVGASSIARSVGGRVETEHKLKESNEQLEKSLKTLEHQNRKMSLVNEMNTHLRSCTSLEDTLSITSLYLKKIISYSSGVVYLMNHSHNYLEAMAEWNDPGITESVFSPDSCWALKQGKIYRYINDRDSIPCKHVSEKSHSYVCVPLLGLNEIIGILYIVVNYFPNKSLNEDAKFFEKNNTIIQSVSSEISLSISNMKLQEALKVSSTRDLLTNLYNRSYLSETFERDLHRAKRNNASIAVVMMDLDHFKQINDTYGHEAGDVVLRDVSGLITSQLRLSDIACRYGGEEIIIILYDTTLKNAVKRMEQLRVNISKLEFRFVHLVTITASFGISMFPDNSEEPNQLIKMADQAMYQSKVNGRNTITVYQDDFDTTKGKVK